MKKYLGLMTVILALFFCVRVEAAVVKPELPAYSSSPYTEVNGNVPCFLESQKATTVSREYYPELDSLGRCRTVFAVLGKDLMPTQERGEIGMVRPSGWHTVKYSDVIADNYLYNRCHLIGYQLSGENANEKNLITGTRYLNIEGMLPFENKVARYIENTGNHVLYRVKPVFEGNNLVASGVEMEAWSVEDSGKGISFNVYCYNVQPGIEIDYATGDSKLGSDAAAVMAALAAERAAAASSAISSDASATSGASVSSSGTVTESSAANYIANTNTHKFHYPSCGSVDDMKEKNKWYFVGGRDDLISKGYKPCGRCHP